MGDNQTYARVLLCIPSRKELTDEKVDELEEILSDSDKVKAILEAGRTSMGKKEEKMIDFSHDLWL